MENEGLTKLGQLILVRLTRWWARRTTIRALRALDDHILRDIGVRRSEISAVVDCLLRAPEPGDVPGRFSSARRAPIRIQNADGTRRPSTFDNRSLASDR